MNVQTGKYGEKLAELYLVKKGYRIVATHWTCRYGEIDIVARTSTSARSLVFVEVKFRKSEQFGFGYEAVNYKKLVSLRRAISYYLLTQKLDGVSWQLDAVCLTLRESKIKVQHFANITE